MSVLTVLKMPAFCDKVSQILHQSGAKYPDSAKKDIIEALKIFPNLSLGTDNFTFPDGKRRPAFRLKGTIPVYYKGARYNIPVTVVMWDTHPNYPPICYVDPTSDMTIRESEHVNKEGKVFLPYLNEWSFPGYDLSGLLQIMSMVFQVQCPLFAKNSTFTLNSNVPVTSTGKNQRNNISNPTKASSLNVEKINQEIQELEKRKNQADEKLKYLEKSLIDEKKMREELEEALAKKKEVLKQHLQVHRNRGLSI